MRLLRCLIMVLATLSMTVHVASARAAHDDRVISVSAHADHQHADATPHEHADKAATADKNCPPGPRHKDHSCCDTPCCSAPCVGPVIGAGAFEPAFRFAARPTPMPDRLPDGALTSRLIRPPIFG